MALWPARIAAEGDCNSHVESSDASDAVVHDDDLCASRKTCVSGLEAGLLEERRTFSW